MTIKTMQMICPPPEREIIEQEVYRSLQTGTISNVARLLHKDQSQVSKAFNPYECDRNNPVYEYLVYLWAFDGTQAGLGDTIQKLVHRERDKWECFPRSVGTEAKLAASVGHEWTDFIEAQIDGRLIDERLAELEDVVVAVENLKKRLIAKRNSVYAEAA